MISSHEGTEARRPRGPAAFLPRPRAGASSAGWSGGGWAGACGRPLSGLRAPWPARLPRAAPGPGYRRPSPRRPVPCRPVPRRLPRGGAFRAWRALGGWHGWRSRRAGVRCPLLAGPAAREPSVPPPRPPRRGLRTGACATAASARGWAAGPGAVRPCAAGRVLRSRLRACARRSGRPRPGQVPAARHRPGGGQAPGQSRSVHHRSSAAEGCPAAARHATAAGRWARARERRSPGRRRARPPGPAPPPVP